jgi:hypothetical protein
LPPGQPSLSSSQHPTIPFQNQQYSYNQPTVGPSLPQLINQPQQVSNLAVIIFSGYKTFFIIFY